jgi:hypothetical protein
VMHYASRGIGSMPILAFTADEIRWVQRMYGRCTVAAAPDTPK